MPLLIRLSFMRLSIFFYPNTDIKLPLALQKRLRLIFHRPAFAILFKPAAALAFASRPPE